MELVNVDKSGLPIVIFKFSSIEPTKELFKNYLQTSESLLNAYDDMVFIVDLSKSKALSSELRIEQGNWNKKNDALMKNKLRGIVFVHDSIIMNMMMKGIFLIKKPAVPYVVVKNMSDALAWANERFSARVAV